MTSPQMIPLYCCASTFRSATAQNNNNNIQLTGCNLVLNFSRIAISSHCFLWSIIFRSCKFSVPSNINDALL